MFLHLLRHAHAGDWSTWVGPDAARPLTDKGRAQSERLGRLLSDAGFVPEVIITSPKARALETAEIVGHAVGVSVVSDTRLAGPLDVTTTRAILTDHGATSTPLLVGHEPDLSGLLLELCGGPDIPVRKGTFVRIEAGDPLRSGGGILRWLVPPDLLKPAPRHEGD